MKKTNHSASDKKKPAAASRALDPAEDVAGVDVPVDEENLAADQFAVAGREEEASSSGHRVEPIINDEEGNAEKLIEEGLHGYMHRSKKAR